MLSDRSQAQRDEYCAVPLLGHAQNGQIHGGRKYTAGRPGLGDGGLQRNCWWLWGSHWVRGFLSRTAPPLPEQGRGG